MNEEKAQASGSRGGGGSQKEEHNLIEQTLEAEGMTQTRGSSNSEQDKFRITVGVEQVCYGYFDDKEKPGITSAIFTGAHFNKNNVDKDMKDFKFRFFQQPAGFEDAVIRRRVAEHLEESDTTVPRVFEIRTPFCISIYIHIYIYIYIYSQQ